MHIDFNEIAAMTFPGMDNSGFPLSMIIQGKKL